ncbi:AB hydrolase-1 domain-containing protein [Caerostris darwini]|uniref:sn-1-specific diacylglycerol lipase ABHD11 n=1 Tax=Caerostris darwini TaxID=1538125 RepID=A0AAV4N8R7_9ARAC|nr:AB hydrolase-1 domain-containing protein [Caerostris darwini]
MRNHGKSGYSNDFTLNHVAADIENFMKSQNISKAVFVAHSMNSRAIMALALTKPELVEKIVIEDMIVTDDPDTPKRAKQIFDFFRIVDKYIKAIPAHLPESEAHKMILPLIKKFFPENVENFSSANMTLSVPIYKDESGKFSWEINMEALFEFEKNQERFNIDLSKNPTFLGEALFLTGKRSYVQLR